MNKKFNLKQSLEEGEIVLDSVQKSETFTKREQDENLYTTDEAVETLVKPIIEESANVEVTVPTSDTTEPTQAEIKFAKGFTGTPTPVDYASIELAQSCVAKKLLADFGADGYARGSLWFQYCKR